MTPPLRNTTCTVLIFKRVDLTLRFIQNFSVIFLDKLIFVTKKYRYSVRSMFLPIDVFSSQLNFVEARTFF